MPAVFAVTFNKASEYYYFYLCDGHVVVHRAGGCTKVLPMAPRKQQTPPKGKQPTIAAALERSSVLFAASFVA